MFGPDSSYFINEDDIKYIKELLHNNIIRHDTDITKDTINKYNNYKDHSFGEFAVYVRSIRKNWSERLISFIDKFNNSYVHDNLIYCERYHRFGHDGIIDIFNETMNELGYKYEHCITDDSEKHFIYVWSFKSS